MSEPVKESRKNQSAKSLIWLAGILVLVGMAVISPTGGLACFVLAALASSTAILLSRGKVRIISIVLTIGAVWMSVTMYPAYKTEMDQYRQRIESRPAGGQ